MNKNSLFYSISFTTETNYMQQSRYNTFRSWQLLGQLFQIFRLKSTVDPCTCQYLPPAWHSSASTTNVFRYAFSTAPVCSGRASFDLALASLSQCDRLIASLFFCCISLLYTNSIKKDLMPGNTRLPKSQLSASEMFVFSVPLLLASPLHLSVPHPSIPCQCVLKLISGLSPLGNHERVCVCARVGLGVLMGNTVPLVLIFRHRDGTGVMWVFLMRFWSGATTCQSQRHKERQTSRVLGLRCQFQSLTHNCGSLPVPLSNQTANVLCMSHLICG